MLVDAFLLATALLIPAHAQPCPIPKSPSVWSIRKSKSPSKDVIVPADFLSQQQLINALTSMSADEISVNAYAASIYLGAMPATPESLAALRLAADATPAPDKWRADWLHSIRVNAVLSLAALGDCSWVELAKQLYVEYKETNEAIASSLAVTLAYAGHRDGWPTIRARLLNPKIGIRAVEGVLLIHLIRRSLLAAEEIDTIYAAIPPRQRLPARAYLYP